MSHDLTALARPRIALVAALAVLAFAAVAALAGAPAAHAATCTPPSYPGQGYFTSLQVTKVSCTYGKKFVKAYYTCRTKGKGVKGRCTRKVLGYSCKEGARTSIPTEFNAKVTCTRGARKIVHTYQQNT